MENVLLKDLQADSINVGDLVYSTNDIDQGKIAYKKYLKFQSPNNSDKLFCSLVIDINGGFLICKAHEHFDDWYKKI